MFPSEDFFHPEKQQKKNHSGRDQVNREAGAKRDAFFWSKAAEHSAQCGQVRS